MPRPVIAFGIDALDPRLLEQAVNSGRVPVLAKLLSESVYARQQNFEYYRTENSWLTFLQGCSPEDSEEWGHQDYLAGSYEAKERAAYRFDRYPPFYALGTGRALVFDVPLVGLVEGVSGIQLLGWGTEVNQILRQSSPPGLMSEVIARHGRHPLYDTITNADDGSETLSYRIPSIYNADVLRDTRDQLVRAVRQRTSIILELMAGERWDLVLCVFAEMHTAGHLFWHSGQSHPLSSELADAADGDFLTDVLVEIDKGLGLLLERGERDADIVIFSPHGMQANSLDLYSMLFLPEMLYRWTSGKAAFPNDANHELPPPKTEFRRHWRDEVWEMRTDHGDSVLESPSIQGSRGDPLDWDPANWYRPVWPTMKSFVLPGYSEGLIRVNVAGRDGPDGVPPEQFGAVCDEITELLHQLTDARTGDRMVEDVVRVRKSPSQTEASLSPADLMVIWRDDLCTDAVVHPTLGRIGPAPYFRSGGHSTEGFVIARGRGLPAGVRLAPVTTADVTATILEWMYQGIPDYVMGKPLMRMERVS